MTDFHESIHYTDFTEENYRRLLERACRTFDVLPVSSYAAQGRVCLWRHDIDFSVHRAAAMAEIEHQLGVCATYYVWLHSEFYNFYELKITKLLRQIRGLGHEIGLHFDATYYGDRIQTREDLEKHLDQERQLIAGALDSDVSSFSFHTPDITDWLDLDDDHVAGMLNSYGRALKDNFTYCSDSNGYWRFKRLEDVLAVPEAERLYILTHPSLWTPEPLQPRQRISRCILGRTRHQHAYYDEILRRSGRLNIRSSNGTLEWLAQTDRETCLAVEEHLVSQRPDFAQACLAAAFNVEDASLAPRPTEDDVLRLLKSIRALKPKG